MKPRFSRTKAAAAVSAALLASVAMSPVHAVNLASEGLGDVGVTTYYTVRNNQQTQISLVNTSDDYVVAVKIRFHEAANSRDARDFNIFLSPNDVWMGVLGMNTDGKTPFIQTSDRSCTAPNEFPAGTANTAANRARGFVVIGTAANGAPIKRMDLTAVDYTGARSDAAASAYPSAQTIVRTQEGYIEIVEMGVALPRSPLNPEASQLAAWAVHDSTGKAADCAALVSVYPPQNTIINVSNSTAADDSGLQLNCSGGQFVNGARARGDAAFQAEFCEPLNVLKVASNIVRLNSGVTFGVPVDTLSNFFNPGNPDSTPTVDPGLEDQSAPGFEDLMQSPASLEPNLASVNPAIANLVTPTGAAIAPEFDVAVDAVSSLFSASSVINEYRQQPSGWPTTAWVVTFPTKNFYVDANSPDYVGLPPFNENFYSSSCVPVSLRYYNREEKTTVASVPPSPPVPGESSALCYETQTISFSRSGNSLSSQFNTPFALTAGYTEGWARLTLPTGGGNTISGEDPDLGPVVFAGLPVSGFSFTVIPNGVVNTNYITPHSYERSISLDQ
jgi:hypothetical protein